MRILVRRGAGSMKFGPVPIAPLATTLYRLSPVAGHNGTAHPPTLSYTIPSMRCALTTVGKNAPKFHFPPLDGVVVTAASSCTPSTA